MIYPSYCKINIGLRILAKRPDGYHDIESLFYPIFALSDIVEVQPRPTGEVHFSASGIPVDCLPEENLCLKAYRMMQYHFPIGGVAIHLHKRIPFGAGLGGGSANASVVINGLNRSYQLNCSVERRQELAAKIGSDTPFFIDPKPMIATGRGEVLTPFDLSLKGYWLTLIKPPVGISTKEAYSRVMPNNQGESLQTVLKQDISQWRDLVKNDFESSVFQQLPLLSEIKERLYELGADYVSLSGSGSTLYALSRQELPTKEWDDNMFVNSSLLEY